MILIIPSIRDINLAYIEPFLETNCRIIVVDDTEDERIRSNHKNVEVWHLSDRKKVLGKYAGCIPHKNGACRDFGLALAYREGEPDELVICLDDDCEVASNYIDLARQSIGYQSLPVVRTAERFYNTLSACHIESVPYVRGFPYEHRKAVHDYAYGSSIQGNIVFNLGVWYGIFDVNAVDKLYLEKYEYHDYALRYDQLAVPPGALVSLCSGNMIMTRDFIPAIYQVPMNIPVVPNWTIDRFGDIWGGYIAKTLADKKGDLISIGQPIVMHHTDHGLQDKIRKEQYAHLVNVAFCDFIASLATEIRAGSYYDMYAQFAELMQIRQKDYPGPLAQYLTVLGQSVNDWVHALGN